MGSKPSNAMQRDRPESGGADRNDQLESSGLLEREKRQFTTAEASEHERAVAPQSNEPPQAGTRQPSSEPDPRQDDREPR